MPKVRISVLRRNYFPELASRYCMNPDPGRVCGLMRTIQ